jgi:hypothetical protein
MQMNADKTSNTKAGMKAAESILNYLAAFSAFSGTSFFCVANSFTLHNTY